MASPRTPRSQHSLASVRLERILSSYVLERGPRDPSIEAMRFPLMVPLFRGLVSSHGGKPPTQHEFSLAVAARSEGQATLAVMARAGRAYISLVVQHHACIVLAERFPLVVWDDVLDLSYGIDLLVITDDGMPVGLALMAPTARSTQAAGRKMAKLNGLPIAIRQLVVRERAYMAGPFWLYSPAELVNAVEDAANEHRLKIARRYFDEGYEERMRDERRGF